MSWHWVHPAGQRKNSAAVPKQPPWQSAEWPRSLHSAPHCPRSHAAASCTPEACTLGTFAPALCTQLQQSKEEKIGKITRLLRSLSLSSSFSLSRFLNTRKDTLLGSGEGAEDEERFERWPGSACCVQCVDNALPAGRKHAVDHPAQELQRTLLAGAAPRPQPLHDRLYLAPHHVKHAAAPLGVQRRQPEPRDTGGLEEEEGMIRRM